MSKLSKKLKESSAKIDKNQLYTVGEASGLVKEISKLNFDPSVDIAVKLGVDPRQANQMVRGVVTLPHGTGKDVKVLALVTADKEAEAKEAGADFVGLDDYIAKIKEGWTDVDVIITMPSVMGKLGALGRVLGPRGLMPNPKTGTIGKASFDANKIADNANELLQTIIKLKPSASKGIYMQSVYMSSTMSPSIRIDEKSI